MVKIGAHDYYEWDDISAVYKVICDHFLQTGLETNRRSIEIDGCEYVALPFDVQWWVGEHHSHYLCSFLFMDDVVEVYDVMRDLPKLPILLTDPNAIEQLEEAILRYIHGVL